MKGLPLLLIGGGIAAIWFVMNRDKLGAAGLTPEQNRRYQESRRLSEMAGVELGIGLRE